MNDLVAVNDPDVFYVQEFHVTFVMHVMHPSLTFVLLTSHGEHGFIQIQNVI